MSPDIERRRVLSGGATALAALLGGCSILPTTDETPRVQIQELSISNLHDEPHSFDVMIRDRETDRIVFWESYAARAMGDRDDDGLREAGGTVWRSPLDSPGDYVLYARAERDVPANDDEWESARLATAGDCLAIEVEIDRDEYLAIEYKYPGSC